MGLIVHTTLFCRWREVMILTLRYSSELSRLLKIRKRAKNALSDAENGRSTAIVVSVVEADTTEAEQPRRP